MQMRHAVRCALLATLPIACSLPSQPARFRPGPCAFTVPAGVKVQCGWLTVPEDRTNTRSRTIHLHVAIYKSRSSNPAPDPILWLIGGPGGRAHVFASKLFARVVEPYLGLRDFIVVDVRGTGYSQPALDCPDRSGPAADWVRNCRDRLSWVADLTRYNSAAVAEDLADLRRALGLHQWNLLAESYGTRLALTALRDHPAGIRAVILDSVVPPDADTYADGPAKLEDATTALFSGCAASRACNAAFPALRAALLRAADELDRSPRHFTGLWHGQPLDMRFDGRQLIQALYMALYESDLIPQLPRAIYHAVDGAADDLWREVLGRHAIFIGKTLLDHGAFLSFHCAEEIPFTNTARLRAEDDRRPWMRHNASGLDIANSCRWWSARPPDPRETMPVSSNIPVLLLAGEYDPVTPPAYARLAAAHLPNSYVFVFAGMGHQLTANSVSSCPQSIVLEFLDQPAHRPQAACFHTWQPPPFQAGGR